MVLAIDYLIGRVDPTLGHAPLSEIPSTHKQKTMSIDVQPLWHIMLGYVDIVPIRRGAPPHKQKTSRRYFQPWYSTTKK